MYEPQQPRMHFEAGVASVFTSAVLRRASVVVDRRLELSRA